MPGNSNSKISITYYQRKPRALGNYSIEIIFKMVKDQLEGLIDSKDAYSNFESSGLFRRIYNCIEAAFRQGKVNHVTGDINYIGLLLNQKKTIQTIHDCVHLTVSTGIKHEILKLFWLTIPIKRSKYVTAVSESTKKEILKYAGCDPNKIRVIYDAIPKEFSRKPKLFNKEKPRILQLGTAHNKNIPRIIEALKGIPCTIDIVGSYGRDIELLMNENKIEFEFNGGLSDEEIKLKYEKADIISLPSTYEGFGMPILEGQATGRVVITSNIFSMPEVAGDAACLVDPFDIQSIRNGFLKVIEDDNYRESLIEKGFENVKRFDPKAIAMQYYELYKSIASEN
jgi:glycosyltransferase involved in cell wall biosynthesis